MVAAGSRGSYVKGRARREEILRVAIEIFAAQGYRGGSLAAIARRVGLSEAGVLHHFPSKEHLLLEVLQLRDDEDRAWVRAVTADEQVPGWTERLIQAGQRMVSRPELARLYATLAAESLYADHPAHAWFRDRNRRIRQELADALRLEQRFGRFPATADPDLTAVHLVAVLEGLQAQWLLLPGEIDLVAALADYLAPYADGREAPGQETSAKT
jgi:AcrR family transcriptional regulator